MKYLNVGCGKKFSTDTIWENIDMVSHSKHVRSYNLIKGFPYSDNSFDAVYHCQVLEHIPKEEAANFLKECLRVLKPGGILRVVVPDLQNIMQEYQRLLQQNLSNPTPESKANYEWMMLEIYDQTIRNNSGGMMRSYLEKDVLVDEAFLNERIGFVGNEIRTKKKKQETKVQQLKRVAAEAGLASTVAQVWSIFRTKLAQFILGEKYRLGNFRVGGEIHYWMYDQFSLGDILASVGFDQISLQNPHESTIDKWADYQLDVKDGMIYDPTSLFMEAIKP